MVIRWYQQIIFPLAFILFAMASYGQSNLKYRISANTGILLNETNTSYIPDPSIISLDGTYKFDPTYKAGFELEVSVPIQEKFSLGIEFERVTLQGVNQDPIHYNYFKLEKVIKLFNYSQQPLVYTTSLNNLIGNVRYFPFPGNNFEPFVKFFGGVSFVGTNLQFNDPDNRSNIFDPLHSRGTKNSTETKWPAFYFGAGLGFEYHLTNLLALYMDASLSIIDTDIVDGVPNFTYNNAIGENEHYSTSTLTTQISIGLCYSIFTPSGDSGEAPKKRGLFKKRRGKIDKYFPFHEIKKEK